MKATMPAILPLAIVLACHLDALAQIQPVPPDPRSRTAIESILEMAPSVPAEELKDLHIVLLACKKDHGPHEHDYPLWQKNWSLLLGGANSGSVAEQINMHGPAHPLTAKDKEGAPNVTVSMAWEWPTTDQFASADLVAAFGVINWSEAKNADLHKYLTGGGGFVSIHQSCVVADEIDLNDEVANLIGLAWNWDMSRWRHGPMHLDMANSSHPICLGIPEQIYFMDEAYWPLYGDRSKVNVLATSKESTKNFALRHANGKIDFSNMSAIQQKWPQEPTQDEPMFWTYQYGEGRVYGCILGHYSWTFDDPYFRLLLLRGMAWAAGESPYRFDQLAMRGVSTK